MPKFSQHPKPAVHHPIQTSGEDVINWEGASAYGLDPKSDLFLLACTNMVGEETFYESASDRDNRFEKLIHRNVHEDPEWVARFAPFLRGPMGMRSASAVLACEYIKAGGPEGRKVVDSVCQRADEPAEIIGYWHSRHGRKLPQPIKRGVADAAKRLYNERNVLRYDGERRGIRFADVIELTHPKPREDWQARLFKYLLDNRHHDDANIEGLGLIAGDRLWLDMPEDMRRVNLRENGIPDGWSWERLAGWLPGGMDAEGWEAVIPNMGVMALIRNLRNFDQKNISDAAIDKVIAKITDKTEVEKSRIWPHQVWAAYREAPSDNWKRALGTTLTLATQNTPELPGSTLILIDMSGSMQQGISNRGTVQRIEIAAVMATAMAKKNNADIVVFGQSHARFDLPSGASTLNWVQEIVRNIGCVGHSTYLHSAIRATWHPHYSRVVVFTDDQAQDARQVPLNDVSPIYTFDLAGYGRASLTAGERGRFRFGGFSDKLLTAIPVLESGNDGTWPF
jgi:hypothetical protein